jgi:flagellar protein FlaG
MSIENVNASSVAGTILQTVDPAANVARREVEKVKAEQVLPSNNLGQERFSQQEMDRAVEQVQVMMDLRNRSVEFTTDESSGARVVKVVDGSSGDVIRQMPAEELLSFMRNLTRMLGTFIDKST